MAMKALKGELLDSNSEAPIVVLGKKHRVSINLQELIDDGYVPEIGDVVYDGQHNGAALTITAEMDPRDQRGNMLTMYDSRYQNPEHVTRCYAMHYYQFRWVFIWDQTPA